jgi:hypothetical protein
MIIHRRGFKRDDGWSSIELEGSIKWDSGSKAVSITSFNVQDFRTDSRHNWEISISLYELRRMMEEVAGALSGSNAQEIVKVMAPSLTSLLRIAVVCSGHRDEGSGTKTDSSLRSV